MQTAYVSGDMVLAKIRYEKTFFIAEKATDINQMGSDELSSNGFLPDEDLTFPASDYDLDGDSGSIRLRFMGLLGGASCLPGYMIDEIAKEKSGDGSSPMADFIKAFDQRLAQLFSHAQVAHDYPVQYRPDCRDPFSRILLCLVGLCKDSICDEVVINKSEMLRYAGNFCCLPRSGQGLEDLLNDYFVYIPFKVEMNALTWRQVPGYRRNCISSDPARSVNILQDNIILGEWLPDRMNHFCIHVGPLTFENYLSLLPGRSRRNELLALVSYFIESQLSFALCLHIVGEDIPPLKLGEVDSSLLGWTTWLPAEESMEDHEVLFENTKPAEHIIDSTRTKGVQYAGGPQESHISV